MANLAGVVQQLRKEHARAVNEVKKIAAALAAFGAAYGKGTATRRLSAAAREKIAAAQRARWAKVKAAGGQKPNVVSMPKKRTIVGCCPQEDCGFSKGEMGESKSSQEVGLTVTALRLFCLGN